MEKRADKQVFSIDEAREALYGLDAKDRALLLSIARRLGTWSGGGAHDLLQEAFLRLLDGRRKCPKDTKLFTFLINEMRSIVSHEGPDHDVILLDEDTVEIHHGKLGMLDDGDRRAQADAAFLLDEISHACADDPNALVVLKGLRAGLTGNEIAGQLGLTIGQVKAANLRIRKVARDLVNSKSSKKF
jgi:DNA-directed RNA polymerase specialized sigma24 family protein